jgi:hypothetical protein
MSEREKIWVEGLLAWMGDVPLSRFAEAFESLGGVR